MEELFRKITLDAVDIPGMPDVAIKVLALLEDELSSLRKMETLILDDQALTANILKIANAPFYQTGKSITTLSEAIMAIGMHNMVALVSVISLINQLSGKDLDPTLIHHAMAVSSASALLARHAKIVTEEEALVAGLLHDIGKTVLSANAPARYKALNEKIKRERRSSFEAEEELFGVNHCRIGSLVAHKWKLPEIYDYTIMNHHNEEIKHFTSSQTIEYKDLLCYIVRMADKVVLDAGVGVGKSTEKNPQALLDTLKVGESVYVEIIRKISVYCA